MQLHSDFARDLDAIPTLARPRLASAFSFASKARVIVALAPAGYGKSFAVRSFLTHGRWIHYRVGRRGVTFARFVRGFAEAIAAVAPGALASFSRAWERALQSGSPESALARWLSEHLSALEVDVVIDDLHDSAADPRIAQCIAEFVRVRANRRLVITARGPGLLPIPLWMATGVMDRPIDELQLRFDPGEVRALASAWNVGQADVAALLEAGGGCPVTVAHACATVRSGALRGELRPAVASFDELADHIYCGRTPRERQFLLSTSLLPSLRPDLLAACGWTDWPALFASMSRDAPFMWEQTDETRCYHDRFADFLTVALDGQESSLRSDFATHAVGALQRAGDHAAALQLAARQGLVERVASLLDGHGFAILESGNVDEVTEALRVIDAAGACAGAVTTALRGYVEARSNRLDTAEAWFRLGLERATDDESRVAIALYYARQLMHQMREDAYEVLEPYADSVTLERATRVDVRSALGQAYMVADRPADAVRRIDEAMRMLGPECSAALQARVLARAAYVAFESGDAEGARDYALRSAPIAVDEGLYDVAASVYTVLYSIAYELDDDPLLCLDYLAAVRDYGMKSGTIRLDLYTLVAMYELYAEAGDRRRLIQLDRAIRAVDINYATPSFLESFLPARAMQAGWAGGFAYAYDVLAPTADRQATPLRRALRWSEVALYAAASGDDRAAKAAIASTVASINQGGPRTTHLAFAQLNCALATWVLGDFAQATRWAQCVCEAALPMTARVRAFAQAVRALLEAVGSPLRLALAVPPTLEALRAASFGGVALLIESLPVPGRPVSDAGNTVGAYIAAQRLDRLYLSAVDSGAHETALFEWLRAAWERDVDGRAIVAAVAAWSAPQPATSPRARLLAKKIAAFPASRRSTAPAIIAAYDRERDVDARIDLLFTDLRQAAPLMAEHSAAVSAWCTRIARRLGLTEDEIAYITRCGLVHDIGKVRTPLAILEAPRRLEPHEWEIMRDHAAEGGRIAASIPALARFVPIIRGHHERLDGKGYPDGLRAGAIPLAARIVTVADCFNAMIGRRAYRLPMSPLAALDELDRNRHSQFDPEVVDAMVHIVIGLRSPHVVTSAS